MNLAFDLDNIETTEFGIGRRNGETDKFVAVPVDREVKTKLHEMIRATYDHMQSSSEDATKYSPSEKYAPNEYLYLETSNSLCQHLAELHEADNLPLNTLLMDYPNSISSYFARLTDSNGKRLTGLRRAVQFKGDIKKRGKLMQLVDDTLKIVESDIFRLDNDFDLIIDDDNVHIIRPRSFEYLGMLTKEILASVSSNIASIKGDLGFVNFDSIEEYAAEKQRGARCLASIKTQKLNGINCASLTTECQLANVKVSKVNGQLYVDKKNVMGFLEVLDRRRYQSNLISGKPESYRATSRQKVS